MGRDLKAFIWSFSLHAMIIIALFAVSHRMTYSKPILIDFSIKESIDSVNEGAKRPSPQQRPEKVRKEEKRIEPQEPVKEMVKKEAEPVKESPVTDTSSGEQAPLPAAPKLVSEALQQGHPVTGNRDIKEMKADS
ncbi:MAG: hypothetical protein ACK415_10480, partial [Thermodesulfovibrionales bacterium]